jgi:hypothetical protein
MRLVPELVPVLSGESRRHKDASCYEWVHSLVDDHSRLAYSELHRDERGC